jgi:hypothetical protein
MTFELSPSEITLLIPVVEGWLEQVGPELRRTEQREYHDTLKSQKEGLENLLHRLRDAK